MYVKIKLHRPTVNLQSCSVLVWNLAPYIKERTQIDGTWEEDVGKNIWIYDYPATRRHMPEERSSEPHRHANPNSRRSCVILYNSPIHYYGDHIKGAIQWAWRRRDTKRILVRKNKGKRKLAVMGTDKRIILKRAFKMWWKIMVWIRLARVSRTNGWLFRTWYWILWFGLGK